uniref:Uncharacterized protein n=1 Tax=Megaselia scalaris TaxID=36166 RepID=T1GCI5_MEGSC
MGSHICKFFLRNVCAFISPNTTFISYAGMVLNDPQTGHRRRLSLYHQITSFVFGYVLHYDFWRSLLLLCTWFLWTVYLQVSLWQQKSQLDSDIEWGYAFDVHLNAFFPPLMLLHFVLIILHGLVSDITIRSQFHSSPASKEHKSDLVPTSSALSLLYRFNNNWMEFRSDVHRILQISCIIDLKY